jgi:hypothetical protein
VQRGAGSDPDGGFVQVWPQKPNIVCSLESVDKLITDAGIPADFRAALEEKGIEVIVAGEKMSELLLNTARQTLLLELQEASRLPERLGEAFLRAAMPLFIAGAK